MPVSDLGFQTGWSLCTRDYKISLIAMGRQVSSPKSVKDTFFPFYSFFLYSFFHIVLIVYFPFLNKVTILTQFSYALMSQFPEITQILLLFSSLFFSVNLILAFFQHQWHTNQKCVQQHLCGLQAENICGYKWRKNHWKYLLYHFHVIMELLFSPLLCYIKSNNNSNKKQGKEK